MLLSTRMGSLSYLKGNGPTDEDDGSSLGMVQELWVDVNSILEETEKMFLQERTMFAVDLTIFTGPTQYSEQCPRDDSICGGSLIRDGEGRMIRALR